VPLFKHDVAVIGIKDKGAYFKNESFLTCSEHRTRFRTFQDACRQASCCVILALDSAKHPNND